MGRTGNDGGRYLEQLRKMKRQFHKHCCFSADQKWLPELTVKFDDAGILLGTFTTSPEHQGFDGRVHGGILAAFIDASMAQCCMGHGVAGYTADLSVRYRKPVRAVREVTMETGIVSIRAEVLYNLKCQLYQDGEKVTLATAKFYRFA